MFVVVLDVLFCQPSSEIAVLPSDGFVQPAVLTGGSRTAGPLQPEQVPALPLQHRLPPGQSLRLGGDGDLDVELAVGASPFLTAATFSVFALTMALTRLAGDRLAELFGATGT